jgi:hypothetical protein
MPFYAGTKILLHSGMSLYMRRNRCFRYSEGFPVYRYLELLELETAT